LPKFIPRKLPENLPALPWKFFFSDFHLFSKIKADNSGKGFCSARQETSQSENRQGSSHCTGLS
jgi:hypothetical protein